MQVVILCGGQGTRAYPVTAAIPKAMMAVAGTPIVEQVMSIYAGHGFDEFILSTGYLKEQIEHYVRTAHLPWKVTCIDTGEATDTGDRIWNLRHLLRGPFHATYCDGLADIDLHALTERHMKHGDIATVTAVPMRSQYGILLSDDDGRVTGFREKPVLKQYWINAGFFVFQPRVFERWRGANLERDVLPELASAGDLHVYRHEGFWRSMDTYKEQMELDSIWAPYANKLRNGDAAMGATLNGKPSEALAAGEILHGS
jgi:glucose-1-phosphate cytidylyltransferase